MLDDFAIRAVLAAIGAAAAAAPLGCFVVWRRMAYFGDATAHAAILGIVLALALGVSPYLGALATALIVGFLVARLAGQNHSADTILGVAAHAALGLGLLAFSFIDAGNFSIESVLFGDILAVSKSDLAVIWLGVLAVFGLLIWRWHRLIVSTLNPDLAHAQGIDPVREQMWLTLSLALVVAVAIKIVGVLLIAALMIIPAAAARAFARTPEMMVGVAVAFGILASIAGVRISFAADTPTGPTIVTAATALFVVSLLKRRARQPR